MASHEDLEKTLSQLGDSELAQRLRDLVARREENLREIGETLITNPSSPAPTPGRGGMPAVLDARVDIRCPKCGMDNSELVKSCVACNAPLKGRP